MNTRIVKFKSDTDNLLPNPDIRALEDQYMPDGEKAVVFSTDCFKEQKNLERVTFIGHGRTEVYGENSLTPKLFVDKLFEAKLPTTIKTIDLIGCEVGTVVVGKDGKKTTFAHEVAKHLYEHKEYEHVRINTLVATRLDKPIIGSFFQYFGSYDSYCISDQDAKKEMENHLSTEIKQITDNYENQIIQLRNRKKEIESELKKNNINPELTQKLNHEFQNCEDQIKNFFKKRDDEIEQAELAIPRLYQDPTPWFRSDDILKSFDRNPNYQITCLSLKSSDLLDLNNPKSACLYLLNNALEKLNAEIDEWQRVKEKAKKGKERFTVPLEELEKKKEPKSDEELESCKRYQDEIQALNEKIDDANKQLSAFINLKDQLILIRESIQKDQPDKDLITAIQKDPSLKNVDDVINSALNALHRVNGFLEKIKPHQELDDKSNLSTQPPRAGIR